MSTYYAYRFFALFTFALPSLFQLRLLLIFMERDWYLVGGAIGDAGLDAGACARGRRTGGMSA